MKAETLQLLISAGMSIAQSISRDIDLHKAGALTEDQLVDKWSAVTARVREADQAWQAAGQTDAAKAAEGS